MRRPVRARAVRPEKASKKASSGSWRDRLAVLLAIGTVAILGSTFLLSRDTQFLMPGPLASAHGAIENCSACHTKSGRGKLTWIHGLVAGDPLADSNACLTCHKMPDTAFNAHSAAAAVLEESTERLSTVAAATPAPLSARAQNAAFPTGRVTERDLYCATCHQEHQGASFDLTKLSNEQCHSCHVVKFDTFDSHHPKFEDYPFKRRTRLIYDHAGHFGKHYPEVAQKDPAKRVPETCSTCHSSREDKRLMAVAPFEQTCATCHLDQITGKERASGPKGIAFLSLPGLDLQTLNSKNASVGEWPGESEADLAPFMKVMIGRTEKGRSVIEAVDSLDLQDLSGASDDQIEAVTNLVWEIKKVFYALISGKASDVLGDLNVAGGRKLSPNLIADLTAGIPRDVLIGAQQQWLPNLAAEMANRTNPGSAPQAPLGSGARQAPSRSDPESGTPNPQGATERASEAEPDDSEATLSSEDTGSPSTKPESDGSALGEEPSGPGDPLSPGAAGSEPAGKARPNAQACVLAVFGQCLLFKDQAAERDGAAGQTNTTVRNPNAPRRSPAAALPPPMRAGLKGAGQPAQPRSPDQTDDLLVLTEEEIREMNARGYGASQPDEAAGQVDAADVIGSLQSAEPASSVDANAAVVRIESDVDPESWAEYGGWYWQDHAIYYRPTGHKDKFIYSWLTLTGPHAPIGADGPAAAVFEALTHKDAPGSCTKCHSIDDAQGQGRAVRFSPLSTANKQGRFTSFVHEPHFGILGSQNSGCLTCHDLGEGRPYLKSYEQGNPKSFVSNFGSVKKETCQTCHTSSMARQDCLLCHKYHVDGVITPIIDTRLPAPQP